MTETSGAGLTRRDLVQRGGMLAGLAVTAPLWACGSDSSEPAGTIVNEIANPRPARGLEGWSARVAGDGARPPLSRRPEGDAGPGSAELALTAADRSGAIMPAGGEPVSVSPGQIVWTQVSARVPVAPPGTRLRLALRFVTADGAAVAEIPIATAAGPPPAGWERLRGFAAAPPRAAACHPVVWLEGVAAPARLRVTDAMVVLDPPALPRYFDGDSPGARWVEAANASASEGPVPGPARAARRDFAFGFNDNASQTSDVPAEVDANLHREVGSRLLCVTVNLASPAFQARRGGRVDWSDPYPASYDRLYRACRAQGVAMVPITLYCPPWMGVEQRFPPPPRHTGAWAELCAQLAERWPAIPAMQVWNEPNLGKEFWSPRPDAAAYTELLAATAERVRQAVPGIQILSGGISGILEGDDRSMAMEEYLEGMYAAGARGAFDGLAFHPYPAVVGTGANFDRGLRIVQDVQARHRDPRPWWITETGVSSGTGGSVTTAPVSEQRQGIVDRLLVALLKERPEVRAACIHTLVSPRQFPRGDHGAGYEVVERGSLRRKPAFRALAAEAGRS